MESSDKGMSLVNAIAFAVVCIVLSTHSSLAESIPVRNFSFEDGIISAGMHNVPDSSLAQPIIVGNPSFEAGTIAGGEYYSGILEQGSTAYWSDDAGYGIVLFDDDLSDHPVNHLDPLYGQRMPDGHQCAMTDGRPSTPTHVLYQTLTSTVNAGYNYSLSVRVASRSYGIVNDWRVTDYVVALIALRDGYTFDGNLSSGQGTDWEYVAVTDQYNMPIPGDGEWLGSPVVVNGTTSSLSPTWIGKRLCVVLTSTGSALWDDVRLTATQDAYALSIMNPSFENGFIPVGSHYNSLLEQNATTYWNDDSAGHGLMLFNNSVSTDPLAAGQSMPDGFKCAMTDSSHTYHYLWQTVSDTLRSGHVYTLSARVGSRNLGVQNNWKVSSYQVALIVGDFTGDPSTGQGTEWEYLANLVDTTNLPGDGLWLATPVVISARADSIDPGWIGEPITVLMTGVGSALWDDIEGTVEPDSGVLIQDNILFYAPLDGSFNAQIYGTASGAPTNNPTATFVQGYSGKGMLTGGVGSEANYSTGYNSGANPVTAGVYNIDRTAGSIAIWVRPRNWSNTTDAFTRTFWSCHDGVNGGYMQLYKYFIYSSYWLAWQDYLRTQVIYVRPASGDVGGDFSFDWTPGNWGHLIASWSGNQMSFYINGQFVGTGYATTPEILSKLANVFGVGSQNGIATSDTTLDDVLVLDRPVTTAEAQYLYKNGPMALPATTTFGSIPVFNAVAGYDPGLNQVVLNSEIVGRRPEELGNLTIDFEVRSLDKQTLYISDSADVTALRQVIRSDGSSLDDGSYLLVSKLTESSVTKGWAEGEFQKSVAAAAEWYGNTLGTLDNNDPAPGPWAAYPITRNGSDVSCWGRTHTWSTGTFPSQIGASGVNLLSRAISLTGRVNNTTYTLDNVSLTWTSVTDTKATFTASTNWNGAPVSIAGWMEFDGFMWYEITIGGEAGKSLQSLYLEIPMLKASSTLKHGNGYANSGAVTSNVSMALTYRPVFWLGNETAGLQWSCQDYKGYNLSNKYNMLALTVGATETVMRINMVDTATDTTSPRKFTVGLQATPVKTLPDDVRTWEMNLAALGCTDGRSCDPLISDIEDVPFWANWNRLAGASAGPYGYLKAGPYTKADMISFLARTPLQKWPYVYWPLGYLWNGDPVLRTYGIWGQYDEDAHPYTHVDMNYNDQSMQDYMVYRSHKLFEDNQIDSTSSIDMVGRTQGYYCDVAQAVWNKDDVFTVLGTRELQKRSYLSVKYGINSALGWPHLKYMNHQSGDTIMSQLSFADQMVTGEHLCVPQLATDLSYFNLLSMDSLRAEYLASNHGIPKVFLPETLRSVLGDPAKEALVLGPEGIPASEHLVGMLWLHDVPIWPAYINLDPVYQAYRARKIFTWDDDTTFAGYWNNSNLVTTAPSNAQIKTSVYRRASEEKALFVVMNNTDSVQTVTITPNWANLGIPVPASLVDAYAEAADPPVDLTVPVSGGSATFQVQPRNFRALVAR